MRVEDRERLVEELFHEALPLVAGARNAFLARACAGDETLRREVESFIKALERRPDFIEESPASLIMQMLAGDDGGALVGRSIGEFKILRLLGGGMSYVYLAENRKLGRKVALKFIAHTLLDDERPKEQLVNEARATNRLGKNPNICAVYDVKEIDGFTFIEMEYVEGQTLDAVIGAAPLVTGRALHLAEQIANALRAVHAEEFIHRDIKPQNIIVAADGRVKVLDFGIAKWGWPSGAAENLDGLPVEREAQRSAIVGTIAYMSPEQARGEELDARTDIFSFGIVLYEMVAGRHPFRGRGDGKSAEDILTAIKTASPPPLNRLAPGCPRALGRIALKCLAGEREQRYQTADALLRDLRRVRRGQRLWLYAQPVLALVLLLAAAAGFVYLRYTQTHTLAVAPVAYAGDDQDLKVLSAVLTDGIVGKLSHLSRLHVRAPKIPKAGPAHDPAEIGRAVQAEAVLVAELTGQGAALQLKASLLKVSDGTTLWQETEPVTVADIQSLQDRLTLKTTAGLRMWLGREEETLLLRHQTDNPEAQRLYLQGQNLWDARDKEKLRAAIELFHLATTLDASYAQAWARLADSYTRLGTVAYGPEPTSEIMDKARAAANKALQSDNTLSEAHTALGVVQMMHEWNWAEAEKEFRLAIQFNPNYSPAHFSYSLLLLTLHRYDEARRESEIYKTLEPFSPMATVNLARPYYRERQFDRASVYLKQVLQSDPNDRAALYMLGLIYVKKGMYPEAINTLGRLYAMDRLYAAAPLGYAYARANRPADARALLEMLEQVPPDKPVPAQEKAIIYMGLRDNDKAFAYLEQAYRERFSSLIGLTTDPFFDDLRDDPRFYDLAARMGLKP